MPATKVYARQPETTYRPSHPRRGRAVVTSSRDYRDFLDDIVGACRSIIQFVEGLTLDTYLADEKTRYAVMRGYEIMGKQSDIFLTT